MTDEWDAASQREELITLNVAFADHERQPTEKDRAWFEARLDERFVFRRANGTVVGRKGFVDGLLDKGNVSNVLDAAVLDVAVNADVAAARVLVALQGRRGDKDLDGVFLNRRLFLRHNELGWQCLGWWNESVPGRSAADGPVDPTDTVLARTDGTSSPEQGTRH